MQAYAVSVAVASMSGLVGDRVDLDAKAVTWQARDLHGRARGTMIAEHPRVDTVHLLELAHVEQEDAAAEDMLQIGFSGLQNGLHVSEYLLGLCLDVGGDRASRGIDAALPRHEDYPVEAHPGRIRAHWRRQIRGANGRMCL